MADDNILARLGARAGALSRVKFGPGVVGKVTAVSLALMMVLAIGMYNSGGNVYLISGLATAALLFSVVVILKMFSFAEKHPAEALLEGGQLIEWRHLELEMATKDFPNLPMSGTSEQIGQGPKDGH